MAVRLRRRMAPLTIDDDMPQECPLRNIPDKNKGFPWKRHQGPYKVIKLPRDAGKTEPMTWAEYRRLHPEK